MASSIEVPLKELACPKCGADLYRIEYVASVTEAWTIGDVSKYGIHLGECYDSYNGNFHHISCCDCETYWDTEQEFIDACKEAGMID